MLRIEGLAKRFGGMFAVQDVSFDVQQGHIHAIIGPNGAGKTTLFNLVSGIYVPTAGRVRFLDRDITGKAPHQLAAMGLSRTFQNLQVCMNMTALDNVLIGAHTRMNHGFLPAVLRLPGISRAEARMRAHCADLMDFMGIGAYLSEQAGSLPYGALKRLEMARALAAEPKLLLLDEPAAGLNHTETGEVAALVRKIADTGVTVLLVEHDMSMVMGISDQVLVLDYGRKLAQGTPEQIRADQNVVKAYLGASQAADPQESDEHASIAH